MTVWRDWKSMGNQERLQALVDFCHPGDPASVICNKLHTNKIKVASRNAVIGWMHRMGGSAAVRKMLSSNPVVPPKPGPQPKAKPKEKKQRLHAGNIVRKKASREHDPGLQRRKVVTELEAPRTSMPYLDFMEHQSGKYCSQPLWGDDPNIKVDDMSVCGSPCHPKSTLCAYHREFNTLKPEARKRRTTTP